MAIIIDGKALAAKCKEEVRTAVAAMERKPGLRCHFGGGEPRLSGVCKKQTEGLPGVRHPQRRICPCPPTTASPLCSTLIAELNRRGGHPRHPVPAAPAGGLRLR